MAKYDASVLDEPWVRVWSLIGAALAFALGAAGLGYWADCAEWRPDLCDHLSCHWFMRSGAVVVMLGTILAFKSGAVLIKRLELRSASGSTGRDMMRPNPRQSSAYGYVALVLLLAGTFIWAFGDIALR
jgi:hypothetical protein